MRTRRVRERERLHAAIPPPVTPAHQGSAVTAFRSTKLSKIRTDGPLQEPSHLKQPSRRHGVSPFLGESESMDVVISYFPLRLLVHRYSGICGEKAETEKPASSDYDWPR